MILIFKSDTIEIQSLYQQMNRTILLTGFTNSLQKNQLRRTIVSQTEHHYGF